MTFISYNQASLIMKRSNIRLGSWKLLKHFKTNFVWWYKAGILKPRTRTGTQTQPGTQPLPVRSWAAQQEVTSRLRKLYLYSQPVPMAAWAPPPIRSAVPWPLLWSAHARDLGCTLNENLTNVLWSEVNQFHLETISPPPTLACGKIVLHKTGPWLRLVVSCVAKY